MKRFSCGIFMTMAMIFLFSLTTVSADVCIDYDTTWSAQTIEPDGDVYIACGATLTLEPATVNGVTVKMDEGANIYVGVHDNNTCRSCMEIQGRIGSFESYGDWLYSTGRNKVIFDSAGNPDPDIAKWGSLVLTSNSFDNRIIYTDFVDGGNNTTYDSMVYVNEDLEPFTYDTHDRQNMESVHFSGSYSSGVWFEDASGELKDCSAFLNADYGVVFNGDTEASIEDGDGEYLGYRDNVEAAIYVDVDTGNDINIFGNVSTVEIGDWNGSLVQNIGLQVESGDVFVEKAYIHRSIESNILINGGYVNITQSKIAGAGEYGIAVYGGKLHMDDQNSGKCTEICGNQGTGILLDGDTVDVKALDLCIYWNGSQGYDISNTTYNSNIIVENIDDLKLFGIPLQWINDSCFEYDDEDYAIVYNEDDCYGLRMLRNFWDGTASTKVNNISGCSPNPVNYSSTSCATQTPPFNEGAGSTSWACEDGGYGPTF